MDDKREKLIELLRVPTCIKRDDYTDAGGNLTREEAEEFADHLIAEGVEVPADIHPADVAMVEVAYDHKELARKYCLLQNDVMEAEKQLKEMRTELANAKRTIERYKASERWVTTDDKKYVEQKEILTLINRGYCGDACLGFGTSSCESCFVNSIKKIIKERPAADVAEVRHSRWVLIEHSFGDTATIICGDCLCQKTIKEERRDFKSVLPKYCENCGAIMDSERKEQT